MPHEIDAIYENGVLRPLVPLPLPERTQVKVSVAEMEPAITGPEPRPSVAKQKEALQEVFEELDKLPQHKNNDGWSVRDHDDLLYGKEV